MLTHSTPTPPGTVVSSGGGGGAAVHGGDHDVRGEVGQPSDSAVESCVLSSSSSLASSELFEIDSSAR